MRRSAKAVRYTLGRTGVPQSGTCRPVSVLPDLQISLDCDLTSKALAKLRSSLEKIPRCLFGMFTKPGIVPDTVHYTAEPINQV